MRALLVVSALLLAAAAAGMPAAANSCFPQMNHVYGYGPLAGHHPEGVGWLTMVPIGAGTVAVVDTNTIDCDQNPLNGPDYDGDLDAGTGGGAFGWGPNAAACGPHNVHGPNVVVNDFVFGQLLAFYVAENDQTATGCNTDGILTDVDPDDCFSPLYVGVGTTCGTGGGDGLYWVVFVPWAANPPVAGVLTAY